MAQRKESTKLTLRTYCPRFVTPESESVVTISKLGILPIDELVELFYEMALTTGIHPETIAAHFENLGTEKLSTFDNESAQD